MPIDSETFLRRNGFQRNPFQSTNAEQERTELASYFVPFAQFYDLLGDTRHPESHILFAPQGFGKTSHRIELARAASKRQPPRAPHTEPVPPALVVPFTSFDLFFEQEHLQADSARYLALIRHATLTTLARWLQRDARALNALSQHAVLAATFHALLLEYAPLAALDMGIAATSHLNERREMLRATPQGLEAGLHMLVELAQAASFASVYFLCDGIDETPQTRRDPEQAARLLSPLLDAPGVLQGTGFAFKFFLPAPLEDVLRRLHIGRLDRIRVQHLRWQAADLLKMLEQRLNTFSHAPRPGARRTVRRFSDLCEPAPVDIDLLLVQAANSSPRRLIDLAHRVVQAHCQQLDAHDQRSSESLIAFATIQRVLADEQPAPTMGSSTRQAAPPALPAPPATGETVPLLLFDAQNFVWVGERRCAPLTKGERDCMAYLWQNRQRTVEQEELVAALYGADARQQRGDPDNSVYKIIRSLRKKLEPHKNNSHTYIRSQRGIGYLLCHYAEPGER